MHSGRRFGERQPGFASLVETSLGSEPDPVFVDTCLRVTRGTPFLVREPDDVSLSLTPWSDPSTRPIRQGRTHDPGLPGFTPPAPAAGYETDE